MGKSHFGASFIFSVTEKWHFNNDLYVSSMFS